MNATLKQLFGDIPAEWTIFNLKELTEIIVDGTHFTPKYTSHGIPFLRVTDLKNNIIDFSDIKYISEEEHKVLVKRCKPQKGDILLSKNGTIGITKIVNWDWEFSIFVSLALIRVKNNVLNNKFLSYFFNSVYLEKQIKLQSKQGTVTNLHLEEIRKFKLPLPPLTEQQKIADILTTVDDKLENIESQIAEYTNLKTGLMQQLLTKGIGHTNFVDSELGQIPEGWKVVRLGDIGEFSKGKGITKSDLIKDGLPCIRYGEIYTVHHYVIKKFYSFISEEVASNSKLLSKNDILFAGSGETVEEIGKAVAYIGDEEAYAGGDTIIFTPKEDNSIFLSYCLNDKIVTSQRTKFGQGNSVVHIYSKDLCKLLVPKPPIKEQQKISDILTTVDDKIESLQYRKEECSNLKRGLMEQLLTGRIRVKV